ncbi:MAG TPA: sugar phosphate isomerase/epimerase family protein [Dehalococcoidia bacterium]|nr:sugar phosphate isomerase/epimerase family protein [Dehalococcoidia bacterium]
MAPDSQPSTLQVSLAAWSMHRLFFAKEIDQLGMLQMCADLGIRGFEFVNTFFPSPQYRYLQRVRKLADELDLRLLLIMCDGEGELAAADAAERRQAVKNHHKWVDIAEVLGCHSIRCNVHGDDSDPAAMLERATESFSALTEYASAAGINVLIENHSQAGHYGCFAEPDWLASLFQTVGRQNFGSLPDFGNFPPQTDRYEAVRKMMPYAKAVSAKCYDFDEAGNETRIDFARMIGIVKEAGYQGFVGIEYEGQRLPEREGILAAKALLERLL